MKDPDWLSMLALQQELRRFTRAMLPKGQKRPVTDSELELLSRLYLGSEESTPLDMSRQTGMKKEAVSRSLKQLFEKGLVEKDRRPEDERSYVLTLTESGEQALEESYGPILKPLYALRRSMGTDFDTLFRLIKQANAAMDPEN